MRDIIIGQHTHIKNICMRTWQLNSVFILYQCATYLHLSFDNYYAGHIMFLIIFMRAYLIIYSITITNMLNFKKFQT